MANGARLALGLLVATALTPVAVHAQSQKPPVQSATTPPGASDAAVAPPSTQTPSVPGSAAVGDGTVAEVVVTAQKRAESIVNVPIALTAVSGEALSQSGVGSTTSLSQVVPALHFDASGAFVQPSIRGVSTAVSGLGAEPNVAVYVDGVYRPNALANDFNFVDVESVQVLKGPQGTLFGRNSTGGAILVTTKTPSFTPTLQVTAGYGSFNTFSGSLYASTGINDKLAVSLAIGGEKSDGFRTNVLTGEDADPIGDVSGRLKLLYTPTDRLKFTLTVDAFRIDDPDVYAVSSYKGYSNAALFGSNARLSIGVRDEISVTPGYKHVAEGDGIALKTEYDAGFANLTSYTAARWDRGAENTNELAAPFIPDNTLPNSPFVQTAVEDANWHYHEDTYSQEFDLSSKGNGAFEWTAGLFGFYDATSYDPFNLSLYGPFGPGGVLTGASPDPNTFLFPASAYVTLRNLPVFKSTVINDSIAVFGDMTYNWGNWHFTLGGRYALDTTNIRYVSLPSVATSFYSAELVDSHNFYALTPRAVIRYSFSPRTSVYVSYSEGTKSGLFNGSGYLGQQTPIGQERIRDVEGGFKTEASGVRLEASVFHYDYSDLQVATYRGGTALFQNAPSAEVYGGDVHLTKRLTDALTIDTGAAYTHAEYTDFTFAAFQYFEPPMGVTNSTTDVTGNTLQRAPEFTGYVSLSYKTELHGGQLALNATGNYQTISYFDFASTLKQPSHGLLNLRADWTDPSKHWTVSVIGQNVTDTTYITQVLPNAGGFGAAYGRPASVTGQVSYKF